MADPTTPSILEMFNLSARRMIDSMQMSDVEFGIVTKVDPLEITTDQKTRIPAEYLTLTNAVKEHHIDISISWATVIDNYLDSNLYTPDVHKIKNHVHQNATFANSGGVCTGETAVPNQIDMKHHHDIKGRKRITVHSGLLLGERVILLRKRGGQNYIVLDRVDEPQTHGENI